MDGSGSIGLADASKYDKCCDRSLLCVVKWFKEVFDRLLNPLMYHFWSLLLAPGLTDAGDVMINQSKAGRANKAPKRGPRALKKPPNAPKRFKRYVCGRERYLCVDTLRAQSIFLFSSFIFFSMAKHKEIKEELARQGGAAKVRRSAFSLNFVYFALPY